MKSEQTRNDIRDLRLSSAEALGEQSREEREKSFSRRALLQWSLPLAAAVGIAAVLVPKQAQAWHCNTHTNHDDLSDHCDGTYTDHDDHGDVAHCNHYDNPYTDHNDGGGG